MCALAPRTLPHMGTSIHSGRRHSSPRARAVPGIRVTYDSAKISFKRVLGAYWRAVDPTRTGEEGQFGVAGPTIIWTSSEDERAVAERSKYLLTRATRFSSATFGPMYKGLPPLTEVRAIGQWEGGPPEDQDWYLSEPKAYAALGKKSGRTKWLDEAFKPVTVTACQKQEAGTSAAVGTVCGFVYFPCSEENGCTAVMNGAFEMPAAK